MILQEMTYAPAGESATENVARNGGQPQSNGIIESHSESGLETATKTLGWFSIALGAVEFLFPKRLARMIGTPPKPLTMRLMGLREIGVGLGILASERKAGWIKARVAGDAIDLAMLKSSFDSRRANRIRLGGTVAGVVAVTAADVIYARKVAAKEAPGERRIRVEASMAVNKPPADCYEFWRDAGNFSKFMKNVEATRTNGGQTHLKVRTGLVTFEWDAEITEEIPNEAISWRCVNRAKFANSGSVRFEPRLNARGTNVRLAVEYDSLGVGLGGAADAFLKTISRHQARENLRRFKSVMECGEFPVTQGQPSGHQTCATRKEAVR
ncbi:MAG TPA: SRPBCC family protein [Bryobacteraceae bacterium]|nr:SRPBCC family protein [Bryobacteraceae bacterium]